jgi:hypothetical protein
MGPLIVVGAVVAFILVSSGVDLGNMLKLNFGTKSPPGPGTTPAKAAKGRKVAGFSPTGAGTTQPSPNSTLATVQQGVVVANQALGFFQNLADYISSPSDSEYPVPVDATLDVPLDATLPPDPSLGI